MKASLDNLRAKVLKHADKTNYVTGRKSETFSSLELAKQYADKWNDKSISVYKNGDYFSTIHKINGDWNEQN